MRSDSVYLARSPSQRNVFKCGYSADPVERMRTLKDPQGKYGATLVAVSTIGIDRELEARRVEASLHAHWASQRVSGEWFKLTRADLDSFHQLVADIRAGLARVYEYPEETASARRARARAVNN